MKKVLALLAVTMVLSGCGPYPSEERTGIYELPDGLRDCHIYRVSSSERGQRTLYVVRCPNSTTHTNYGGSKNDPSTTVSYVEENN